MENKKFREFKAENKFSFALDVFLLLLVAAAAMIIFPYTQKVGFRNTVFLDLLFTAAVVCFMFWLEKYEVYVSGIGEKRVITVLSFIYTYVIVNAANFILFMEMNRFLTDLFIFVSGIVLTLVKDHIMYIVIHKRFRAPRLIILGLNSGELKRMKKVRYGILEIYDTWYEILECTDKDDVKRFAEERFRDFEAVCIFNDFSDAVYATLVNTATAMNKDIYIIPKMVDVSKINAKIVRFDDILSLHIQKYHITGVDLLVKRFLDIVVSLIMTAFAAIPMLIIALLIKLTSPGPVLYKQQRLTKDKKVFWIYKFRTMVPDAEKLTGPVFAQKDDPRITPIGKILRRCRLDELPQLINILKGDMSVVGPRPERPEFVDMFSHNIQNYDYRFKLKSGLTSLSHVYGRYSTYIHDRTYYDLFYIANYSILLDLKILLLTSKTMFIKSAAEGVEERYAEREKEGASA